MGQIYYVCNQFRYSVPEAIESFSIEGRTLHISTHDGDVAFELARLIKRSWNIKVRTLDPVV